MRALLVPALALVSLVARAQGTTSTAPAEASLDPASLQPYFAAGKVADAAVHLRAGRVAEARALIPKDEKTFPVGWLRAEALEASNEWTNAAEAWVAVIPSTPAVLVSRAHCNAAAAFGQAGAHALAGEHVLECASDPVRGRRGRIDGAKTLELLGRRGDAAELLAPLLEEPSPLRPEALLIAGRIREAIGQHAWALEAYRRIIVDDAASPQAKDARARAAAIVKKLGAPAIAVEKLLDRTERLLKAKRRADAEAELRSITTGPICAGIECAPKRCEGGKPGAPAMRLVAAEVAPFTLADAKLPELVAPAMPSCAVKEVEAPANATACKAELLRGWTLVLKGTRKAPRPFEEALTKLRPVYQRCADPDVRAQALALAAEAALRSNDADAESLALVLALQFPKQSDADDRVLAVAARARDEGDLPRERAFLQLFLDRFEDSPQRAEALFRLFWSHRADGHPERALGALEILAKEYDAGPRGDGGDAERGRYWWGRTLATHGREKADRDAGLDRLGDLARERPLTYYGVLARSFLTAAGEGSRGADASAGLHTGPLKLGPLENDGAFQQAVEFLRLGAAKEAREAFFGVRWPLVRIAGRAGQEATVLIAELLLKSGDARSAHVLARRELLGFVRHALDPLARRGSLSAYPLVFREHIVTGCTAAAFEPDFLQGLMREESALDPRAKSPVGARGLTQVMPATARQVARSIGLRTFDVEQLWDPATNIRLGSSYLGSMLRKFGHPGLAAAAYNAGPGAVARWLDAGPDRDFDVFVEEIPFSETRGYVKRVLRSYAAYRQLYGEGPSRFLAVSTATRPPPSTAER